MTVTDDVRVTGLISQRCNVASESPNGPLRSLSNIVA